MSEENYEVIEPKLESLTTLTTHWLHILAKDRPKDTDLLEICAILIPKESTKGMIQFALQYGDTDVIRITIPATTNKVTGAQEYDDNNFGHNLTVFDNGLVNVLENRVDYVPLGGFDHDCISIVLTVHDKDWKVPKMLLKLQPTVHGWQYELPARPYVFSDLKILMRENYLEFCRLSIKLHDREHDKFQKILALQI